MLFPTFLASNYVLQKLQKYVIPKLAKNYGNPQRKSSEVINMDSKIQKYPEIILVQ